MTTTLHFRRKPVVIVVMVALDPLPDWLESLSNQQKISVCSRASLRQWTTLKIGGPACWLAEVIQQTQLSESIRSARAAKVPYYVVGGDSNLLFNDEGWPGLVIVNRCQDTLAIEGTHLIVSSGFELDTVVQFALEHGLAGITELSGIPGTIGGGVIVNAGAFGASLGEVVVEASVVDQSGNIRSVAPDFFGFSYRHTRYRGQAYSLGDARGPDGPVVLQVRLNLTHGDPHALMRQRQEILDLRAQKHPSSHLACAGSWFKNLPPPCPDAWRVAAGKILDEVGAKKLRVGDAGVFEHHANILVNYQQATAADMLLLAEKLQELAYQKKGVKLETEVIFVPYPE